MSEKEEILHADLINNDFCWSEEHSKKIGDYLLINNHDYYGAGWHDNSIAYLYIDNGFLCIGLLGYEFFHISLARQWTLLNILHDYAVEKELLLKLFNSDGNNV